MKYVEMFWPVNKFLSGYFVLAIGVVFIVTVAEGSKDKYSVLGARGHWTGMPMMLTMVLLMMVVIPGNLKSSIQAIYFSV